MTTRVDAVEGYGSGYMSWRNGNGQGAGETGSWTTGDNSTLVAAFSSMQRSWSPSPSLYLDDTVEEP